MECMFVDSLKWVHIQCFFYYFTNIATFEKQLFLFIQTSSCILKKNQKHTTVQCRNHLAKVHSVVFVLGRFSISLKRVMKLFIRNVKREYTWECLLPDYVVYETDASLLKDRNYFDIVFISRYDLPYVRPLSILDL